MGMEIKFTRGSRKHKVGRDRARQVLAQPMAITPIGPAKYLVVGEDLTGRPLEIIYVLTDVFLVIHVMDLRPRNYDLYEAAKEQP